MQSRAQEESGPETREVVYIFQWSDGGESCEFVFHNSWLAIRFDWGHSARDREWGQA